MWSEVSSSPILSTFSYPTGISLRDSYNLDMPSYLCFISLCYVPISFGNGENNNYFLLNFVKSMYLVVILIQWSRLWLFTANNQSHIQWLFLYATYVVLQNELLQLLISFLYMTFFQRNVSQKNHCEEDHLSSWMSPILKVVWFLVLWDSINVKSRVVTIVISEAYHLHRIWNQLHRINIVL